MFKPKCEKNKQFRPLSMNLLEKTRRNKETEIDLNKKQCAVASRPSIHSFIHFQMITGGGHWLGVRGKTFLPLIFPSRTQIRSPRVVCASGWQPANGIDLSSDWRKKNKTLSFDMKHQFRRVTRDSHCIARAGRRHLIFDSIVFIFGGVQSVPSLWSFDSKWQRIGNSNSVIINCVCNMRRKPAGCCVIPNKRSD